jgi:transmembrane sensor
MDTQTIMTDHHHEQIEREAALWLARRDAGGWGARQQSGLETWLAANLAHRVAFLRLESAWNEAARLKVLAAGASHEGVPPRGAWQHSPYFAPTFGGVPDTRATIPAERPRVPNRMGSRRWPAWLALAAGLLFAVIAGGWWWRDATHVDRDAWQTALGARQTVRLADGSVATLGSDSALRVALSRHERDLYLPRGEVFFDVAHDPARPFVVHANGYRVIAVGTRFDVRREKTGLRVVVTRGLVRLQSASDPAPPPTMLPAGSIALVDGNDVVIRHIPLDQAQEYLSWRSGYVVFHGTPLAKAVEEFNRYNSNKIVIADPSLDDLKVGGHFRLDNSAAFIRLTQQIFPVRATLRGSDVVLSRRNQAQRN